MSKPVEQTAPKKLRILLAEDHEMVREGLKALVNAQPDMDVVGEASDGRITIQRTQELEPDVIVMDITMPVMNGLRATEKITQSFRTVKILTLTRHADVDFAQQMFRAGASGYILKQSASIELIRAIRTLAAGGTYIDPAIADKIITGYVGKQARLSQLPKSDLSERETEVLRLIAWGYSNKEIATHLEISVKTVEAHKANTMKKLNLHSRIDIVRFALLQGWLQDN